MAQLSLNLKFRVPAKAKEEQQKNVEYTAVSTLKRAGAEPGPGTEHLRNMIVSGQIAVIQPGGKLFILHTEIERLKVPVRQRAR